MRGAAWGIKSFLCRQQCSTQVTGDFSAEQHLHLDILAQIESIVYLQENVILKAVKLIL